VQSVISQNVFVANDTPVANHAPVQTYQERVLEENAVIPSKFSGLGIYSPVLSNEYVIEKKGIAGRAKLGIKSLGDKTLNSIESVYLKYSDLCKRKFV